MKASEDMKAYLQERIAIDDNGCREGGGVKRWQELARATTT